MDPEYARRYRELYEKHWWWRAREEAVVALLRRFQPPGGYGCILDAGCGDGLFFPRLSEFGEVDGLEPDAHAVNPSGPFAARIHRGPFDDSFRPGRRYGLILMLDVLEHLPDPASAVRRVHSLLVPGGVFVATVPAFQALWTTHDVLNRHFKRYTRAELRRLLTDAGLRVATSRSCSRRAATLPTLPKPCTATRSPFSVSPSDFTASNTVEVTPRPVASTRPSEPPRSRGFPVTTPGTVMPRCML